MKLVFLPFSIVLIVSWLLIYSMYYVTHSFTQPRIIKWIYLYKKFETLMLISKLIHFLGWNYCKCYTINCNFRLSAWYYLEFLRILNTVCFYYDAYNSCDCYSAYCVRCSPLLTARRARIPSACTEVLSWRRPTLAAVTAATTAGCSHVTASGSWWGCVRQLCRHQFQC